MGRGTKELTVLSKGITSVFFLFYFRYFFIAVCVCVNCVCAAFSLLLIFLVRHVAVLVCYTSYFFLIRVFFSLLKFLMHNGKCAAFLLS